MARLAWGSASTAEVTGPEVELSVLDSTLSPRISKALGLGHAGNYNGNASFGSDAHYANESWQTSVMSYFTQDENPNVNATKARVSTPQIADIIAIQNLYGANSETRIGDNATSDHNANLLTRNANIIYDGGGTDTIDLRSRSEDQPVDLNAETFSDINNEVGNDTMLGTNGANALRGYGGNDKLYGRSGADKLYGGSGADMFHFDRGEGVDIVMDFENNIDRIELDNFSLTKAQALDLASQVGDDVVFDFGADGMLTIENATISQIENDLFMV